MTTIFQFTWPCSQASPCKFLIACSVAKAEREGLRNLVTSGFLSAFFPVRGGGGGGGGKMGLYGLLEGKYVFMCKACGKLGGSGGMLPREILTLDLTLDTIW